MSTKAITAMTRKVVCVTPQDSLQSVHEIMVEWGVRHIPVLEGKKLVGIVSDRDVLLNANKNGVGMQVLNKKVSEAMTVQPMTCKADTPVARMIDMMLEFKIDSLPIIDEDKHLIGLVTSSDLMQLLKEREETSGNRVIPFQFQIHEGAENGRRRQLV